MKPTKKDYIEAFKKACKTATKLENPENGNPVMFIHIEGVSIFLTLQKIALKNRDFTCYEYQLEVDYQELQFKHVENIKLTEKEYNDLIKFCTKCYKALISSVKQEQARLKQKCEAILYNYINEVDENTPISKFSYFVEVGKTNLFNSGISEVHFNVCKEESTVTGFTDNKIKIITDRDIYYENILIAKKGNQVPFFKFPNFYNHPIKVVIDLRINGIYGSDFKPEKLTKKFLLTAQKI